MRTEREMASIVDVAKKAKVSIATVSRTLNNDSSVAPATAKLVRDAAKAVGYVPRAVRPGPKPAQRKGVNTGVIAFLGIGPYDPAEMYSMPIMPALLGGIQRGAARHGMELALGHMPDEKSIPPVLARRRADGILIFCEEPPAFSLRDVLHDIPAVFCLRGAFDPANDFDHVQYDNARTGPMALEYLLDRNCQRIIFASSNLLHPAYSARRDGFVQAAESLGISPELMEANDDLDAAVRMRLADALVEKLMGLSEKTGVFCASDDVMLSVLNKLGQGGIEPGKDIELIGCNNDPVLMAQMHPRPATIDIKLDAVGERAMDQLFWRMSHRDDKDRVELLVKPELISAKAI